MKPTPYLRSLHYETGKWRSPVCTSAIIEDIKRYTNDSTRPTSLTFRMAVDYAFRRFAFQTPTKMLHLNDVFQQDLDIWSKSPGLPWRDLGYKSKDDIRKDPEAIRKVRLFWHKIKGGENRPLPDCMGLVRAHVCERGTRKVRAVWGYPATVTFGEAVFALPLIRKYQAMADCPMAYGYETAVGGMAKITKRFRKHPYYAAIDFKNFDKSAPAWLIRIAFDVLRRNIDFGNYQDHGVADARRMYHMFDVIEDYFINTTVRVSDGSRFRKFSGVASGSYFTQLVDSIINCILIAWCSYEQFGTPPKDDLYLGDDSLIGTDSRWNLDVCCRLVSEIGMQINQSKSVTTDDLYNITFLGYKVGMGTPFKAHDDWMTSLMFPEIPDRDFAAVQSRAIGLLYANMGVDVKFHAICSNIIRLQPFDIAIPRNFGRMLKHIGVHISTMDPTNIPDPAYFFKYMV